ncbi:hypothetical protein Tco_0363843 [Tanacetum coccineum]
MHPILSIAVDQRVVVYCDTSNQGLGCVLMQRGKVENATTEMLCSLDQLMERKEGGDSYKAWSACVDHLRSWWKIYFAVLVDIEEGIKNMAITCVRLIILKRTGQSSAFHSDFEGYAESSEVGDKVMWKCLLGKNVLHFGKVRPVCHHDMWEPYWTDANLHVHLEKIKVDKTLRFAEESVKIIDREVKSLKRSRIDS